MLVSKDENFMLCKKEKCIGCGACAQICTTHSIFMEPDSEGFLYPTVLDSCVQCGMCRQVCPAIKQKRKTEDICDVYAGQLLNKDLLKQSTSGGVFILLASHVIKRGGVVFGACYDRDMVVNHTYAETLEGVFPMQGSKYVQSNIGDAYIQARSFVNEGRYVLFSGTPCQIEGLLSFLGRSYEKLILLDIICGGVPSPLLFAQYLNSIEQKKHSRIIDYKFRDKQDYGCSHTTVIFEKVQGEIKRTVIPDRNTNNYYIAFGKQAFVRPACYACPFNVVDRRSDFTCGGYFGNNPNVKSLGERDGVSQIVVHTEKGRKILEEHTADMKWMTISLEDAKEGNHMLGSSMPLEARHPEMFQYLAQYGYVKTAHKFFPKKKFIFIRKMMPTSIKKWIVKNILN